VKDLTPYLGKTRVFVAPLRYGAGVKGKIVTAMSYGVPVVTTTIGSEGLRVVHGEDCLIADDPAQFAHAVVELYTNRSLWERLSKNAVALIREDFSEKAAKKELMKILAQVDVPYKEVT
jgi:glycosyltransferase involved in cell wall biosynthesis